MDWILGIIFIAIACFLLSYLILKIKDYGIRAILTAIIPLILSYLLYWGPVWVKGIKDKSEYESWSLICIVPWAITGIVSMIIGLVLLPKLLKTINKKG
jgi:hypothetical protein